MAESAKTLADIPSTGSSDALVETRGGPTVSHDALAANADEIAAIVRNAGYSHGAVVSIVLPNSVEFVATFLGVVRARCIAAPLNSQYSEEEFAFYLEDANAKLVVVSEKGNEHAEAAAAKANIAVCTAHMDGNGRVTLVEKTGCEWDKAKGVAASPVDPEDVAMVLHTSGTTSKPKQVPLTHANMSQSVRNIAAHYKMSPADRTYLVMPLFHVHGLMCGLLATLATGGCVVIPQGGAFSAGHFWSDFVESGCNWYTAVPTIHQILLLRADKEYPKKNPPQIRFIRSCSSSLAASVLHELEQAFGAPVIEAYAMTEAAHQMTSNPLPEDGQRKAGTVGMGTNVRVAILDDENQEVARGREGEVCIQGANVTKGYINRPEANEEAFAGGWFHTGDQGFIDEDGMLVLTGRIKELINRGGEKISPLEVDAALLSHPDVAEAVSFAAPDKLYGEVVNAAVVLKPDAAATTAEDILAHCKSKLAAFKIPARLFIADQVPKTATGKIQRRHVSAHFLQQGER